MSTDRDGGDSAADLDDDGLNVETRNEIINHAEALTAVDGPLVGERDAERAEDLIGRMFEAVGGTRLSYAEADAEDLVIEADGDDTHWRKHSSGYSARAVCGPFGIRGTDGDAHINVDESWIEVLPNGQDRGIVTIDTHLEGEFEGIEYEQGALHELTPRQARTFAAALVEQAEYVENATENGGEDGIADDNPKGETGENTDP